MHCWLCRRLNSCIALRVYTGSDSRTVNCLYMLWILTFGDCFTDSSLILVAICLQTIAMRHFGRFSECRCMASQMADKFQFYNHTPHAGILYLVLIIADPRHSCSSACTVLHEEPALHEEETFCSSSKCHTDRAATRNQPIKLNQQYLELITD